MEDSRNKLNIYVLLRDLADFNGEWDIFMRTFPKKAADFINYFSRKYDVRIK